MKRNWVYFSGFASSLLLTGSIYSYGLLRGAFFLLLPDDEICIGKQLRESRGNELSVLPLRSTCHWRDGTSTDLVPRYVNPALFAGIAISIACLALLIWSALYHRAAPQAPDGSSALRNPHRHVGSMSFLLLAAALSLVYGFWAGRFLDLRPVDEYCARKPFSSYPSTSWGLFPLERSCQWSDGTSTDLVPWYVNPVMFAFLAAAVFSFALAIQAALHNRATLRRAAQGDQTDSDRSPGAPGPVTHGKT
jgi:hypothetical protein